MIALMHAPRIDVIVVTHCSRATIDACLETLNPFHERVSIRVFVVDSGSTDGTADHVRAKHPHVFVRKVHENIGFARSCNLAFVMADAPYVLLLNPDTEIMPGSLGLLVQHLERHPRIAAVGPCIVSPSGEREASPQAFPSVGSELTRTFERIARPLGLRRSDEAPRSEGPVDWVSGACMLIRREAIRSIGPLDPAFFLYFEETDWCLRARQDGWDIHHVPQAVVCHVGGASVASTRGPGVRRADEHFSRSRRYFFRKHHGWLASLAVDAMHRLRSLRPRPVRTHLQEVCE